MQRWTDEDAAPRIYRWLSRMGHRPGTKRLRRSHGARARGILRNCPVARGRDNSRIADTLDQSGQPLSAGGDWRARTRPHPQRRNEW